MQNLGLNSDINLGNQRLHVQTNYSESGATITANVFDSGRVVESHEAKVAAGADATTIEATIKKIHQQVVADIELLFYIGEKVQQVKHPVSCNKIGQVLLQKGFVEHAIKYFELATAVDPKFGEAYNNLGLCYLDLSDLRRAEEILRHGLEMAPGFADLHLNLGRVHLEKKAWPDAVRTIDAALNLNESYFEANYYMGLALLNSLAAKSDSTQLPPASIRMKRVFEYMSKAADIFKPFANEKYQTALSFIEKEKFEEAVAAFNDCFIETNKRMDLSFENEFFLKFMYGGKGKDNQFIGGYVERLKSSIDDYPKYADLHNSLGIAYLIMCRNLFLKALDEFRKALVINPRFKRAEKNLKLAENDGKGFLILLRAILK
ncbi:MAG: hypothetical protein DWQ05_03480 [Calditrichaeota bacterium]|nr:MAG: hypothetical protein DWQ05_03480 [Calditrichota bacterium]